MKKIKNIFESIKLKWLKETSLTLILIAIIIGAFVGINIGVDALNLTDIDLTSEKLYSLSDTSKEQIAKIPKDEKIEIYLFGYIENSSIADLIKQYIKINNGISLEITSTEDRKDLASKYSVAEEDYNSTILIVSGEKYKKIDEYSLYTYDYTNGSTIDIAEQRITNGIISVSSIGTTMPIYMLTGHEEYSSSMYMTTVKTYLELENYQLKDLDLLVEENVPEDCETIIIASPKKDLTTFEAEKIKKYINEGGSILWLNDVMSLEGDAPNLQSVLDLYGITIDQKGIVIEQDTSRMVMQTPDIILPNIQYTELTQELASQGHVMFLQSSRLTFVEESKLEELGVTKTDLLTTSEKAFFRKDLSIPTITPTDTDEVGEQVVGALLEKKIDDEKTSKLVVYANNSFATDKAVSVQSQTVPAVYFYNNLDLVLNSVAYIAKAEDQITIRKNIEVVNYTATEEQNKIVQAIIFGVPILIVIVGIIVWQYRRRKK